MPHSKTASNAEMQQNAALRDLFAHVIPPSPLHRAVQEAARQEGWSPFWEHKDQAAQGRRAGKKSAAARGTLASLRRSLVHKIHEGLPALHHVYPYSNDAIDAL